MESAVRRCWEVKPPVNELMIRVSARVRRSRRVIPLIATLLAVVVLGVGFVRPAMAASQNAAAQAAQQPAPLPGEGGGPYADPLAPFNEAMFRFNLDLDQWVVTPVAKGYSYVLPAPARRSVGNFFNNVGFLPRFANNLLQLRFEPAATELARFGINTTLGAAGLFDVANSWFGLKEQPDDFGLTMGHYGIYSGSYIMLPFLGPSTIRDTVGLAVDGTMNPMSWMLPWWVSLSASAGSGAITAVNYRSFHPDEFEEADRYAIDLYGAVQDAYMQDRTAELTRINR
jgi:phospholipid-binding lipoprotein MlaA